jgi:ethanolamine ammonia-lyase large subunit
MYLRSQFKLRAAPEFEAWLERMDMQDRAGRIRQLQHRSTPLLADV